MVQGSIRAIPDQRTCGSDARNKTKAPVCRTDAFKKTDRAGFEPAVPLTRYAGLANRCLQPLGHLSRGRDRSRSGRGVQSLIVTETRSCVPPGCPAVREARFAGRPASLVHGQPEGEGLVRVPSMAVQQWTPRVPVSLRVRSTGLSMGRPPRRRPLRLRSAPVVIRVRVERRPNR